MNEVGKLKYMNDTCDRLQIEEIMITNDSKE